MNVQGRLTDASGDPVADVLVDFTFKIFDAEVGGSEIWPGGPGELQALGTDANGLWNARVGAFIPLTDGVFADSTRWLEVTVEYNAITETLPRIKLNKSPYTSDQYVNTSGDVMSGRLSSPWTHADDGLPNIDVQNENGTNWGWGGNGTVAVSGFATGNGPETKWGVVGLADGNSGIVVGVYGQANGTSTSRYSGYFSNGDFLVENPATAGDASVQLPDSAIASAEILDEPGITTNRYTGGGISLVESAVSQDFMSVTITIPASGYIVVEGVAYFTLDGDNASFAWVQIGQTPAAPQATGHYVWVNSNDYSNSAAGYTYQTIPVRRVFVRAAGTYTFYLQGNEYILNDPSADAIVLSPSWLQATYYPTSYGSVVTVASSEEASEFANATAIAPTRDAMGATASAETIYLVDLRELEIKLKNAELAVERARRELVEAQLRQTGPTRNENSVSVQDK
jgi:hypothetical protein